MDICKNGIDTDLVAAITFLNLALQGPHTDPSPGTFTAHRVIEDSTVPFQALPERVFRMAPFKLKGQVKVFKLLFCHQYSKYLSRHPDDRGTLFADHGKYFQGIVVKTNGLKVRALLITGKSGYLRSRLGMFLISIPAIEIFSVKQTAPFIGRAGIRFGLFFRRRVGT